MARVEGAVSARLLPTHREQPQEASPADALGVGLGLFPSALVTQAVSMDGLPLTVPIPALTAFTLLAVAAGIGAAVLPARRASRLNVLEALHYE